MYGVVDGVFIQGLREIRDVVSQEEYSWAELHMAKFAGLITLFSSYGTAERIRLVKEGYARHKEK